MREFIITSILKRFDQKNLFFFEGCSWFKFNNLGVARGMALTFYLSVAKWLKLKVRKFWRLNPTFVEETAEKLVAEAFCFFAPPPPRILNRVKNFFSICDQIRRFFLFFFLFEFSFANIHKSQD